MTPREFFGNDLQATRLFAVVELAVSKLSPHSVKTSKSQIAFRRKRNFAVVWRPTQCLHGEVAPLVLTILAPKRIPSRRWKEVVQPAPGRFTHHLELYSKDDVDDEVRGWLRLSWELA